MQTNNLPTDELKKYGIVEPDNSFSKKLSAEDIQKFLQGYSIVADNKKNKSSFSAGWKQQPFKRRISGTR